MEVRYRNTGYFILLLIPLTIAGYYKSYISQIPHFNEYIRNAHHFHAVVSVIWLGLLIVQSFLVRAGKMTAHRTLGKASYFVFVVLIGSFIPLIHSDSIILFPIADMLLLICFYTMGIIYRKQSDKHMRYMIALTLVFLDPTLGRVVFRISDWFGVNTLAVHHITLGVITSILIVLVIFDRINNKNFKPYLLALSLFIVYQILYYLIYVR